MDTDYQKYYDTDEPILHTHVDDILPDDHPLAFEHLRCELCMELVHADNNECMRSWVEFCGKTICLKDFLDYLNTHDADVVEQYEFLIWFDNKKATK